MKTVIRVAAALTATTTTFFAVVLGVEYATWFYNSPADPLADPALNAVRFAVAALAGMGAGFIAFPKSRKLLS